MELNDFLIKKCRIIKGEMLVTFDKKAKSWGSFDGMDFKSTITGTPQRLPRILKQKKWNLQRNGQKFSGFFGYKPMACSLF